MTIREWYFTQHVPAELQDKFEQLFDLADFWRSHRAHTYASENADHYQGFDAGLERCADTLDSILGKAKP